MTNDTLTPGTTHDLVITHAFDASVEQVWNAWNDPAFVKQWWGPDGFTAPLVEMDVRVGGTSLLCMSSPQFGDSYSIWQYEDIVPLKRLSYIHNLADKHGNKVSPASVGMPPDFPEDQRHDIIFEDLGDNRTRVTVTEYGWTVGQMMTFSRMGMSQCLDKMDRALKASGA